MQAAPAGACGSLAPSCCLPALSTAMPTAVPPQPPAHPSRINQCHSVASDLARATGLADAQAAASNRLNKIVQLTGFSDPIYAEAYVTGACRRESGGG